MTVSATVVADSVSPAGKRLTTVEVVAHRFILAEINTHRVLSRSYRSSRAVPSKRLIEEVRTNPAMPVFWGKNQAGMQAREELDDVEIVPGWVLTARGVAERRGSTKRRSRSGRRADGANTKEGQPKNDRTESRPPARPGPHGSGGRRAPRRPEARVRSFVILRVPAVLDENRDFRRRPSFGSNPTVVAELDSIEEAGARLADLQRRDERHHYYGLEVRLTGAPGRNSANVVEAAPARTAVARIVNLKRG